jgi:T5SS/PEP-CTERM-associated repeat protein
MGRVNVNSGGTLSTGDIVVGDAGEDTLTPAPASIGRVAVDSGGRLESTGDIVVGNDGTATLTLQSSGLVQTKGTIFVNKGGTGNPDSIQAADSTIETAGGITILGLVKSV